MLGSKERPRWDAAAKRKYMFFCQFVYVPAALLTLYLHVISKADCGLVLVLETSVTPFGWLTSCQLAESLIAFTLKR